MVRNITYNTNEMVYRTSGKLKSHERKYLNDAVPQNTTTFVDTIKSKY
jgi:hypothetical protein